jgi:hypothetical protein
MKKTIIFTAVLLISLLPLTVTAGKDDPEARKIMEMVDDRDDGDNQTADMTMVLIDKQGKKRVRKIATFFKDFGKDTYRLMFFLHPPNVKDTGFLTYDYKDWDKDDDQWLYLPALRKTKRIATVDKSGSFMGSDLNYSDMTSRNLTDYDFSFYQKEKEMDVRGHKVWLIEAIPRSDDVIDETGYKKQLLFVRQDNYIVVRAALWEDTGGHIKYMDAKTLEKINGIWVVTERQVARKKDKTTVHKTILTLENVKFNQELDKGIFSIRRLEKGL